MRLFPILSLLAAWCLCQPAAAQFATVINVPPDVAPVTIGSDTQVNVGPGGIVYTTLYAGDASLAGANIEVNVTGGELWSSLVGYRGSTINVSGGVIRGWTEAYYGSTLNVSGGTLPLVNVHGGGAFNFSGGQVSGGFTAKSQSTVNVAGGHIGQSDAESGSTVNVIGGRVQMLAKQGSTVHVSSGTLDGLWLGTSAQGATITMTGGEIGDYYRATANSRVNITGGAVGYDFRVDTGSTLTMSAGSVGESMNANMATINLSGGAIGGDILGNTVTINLSGSGELGSGQINSNSKFTMTGGLLKGGFSMFHTAATVSGGVIDDGFRFYQTNSSSPSSMRISGRDFRLDGVPITVTSAPYPVTGVLSGVLADGTPFAFSGHDYDSFDAGTLTLVVTSAPAAAPGTIRASTDAIPRGVRQGQTLLVDAGGVVGDHFNAGFGSVVTIEPGGQVGKNFEAVGATVSMSGGALGDRADLFSGAIMTMSGGQIGASLDISKNSTLNMAGGTAGNGLLVHTGGTLNLSGGTIGDNMAVPGGTANISGGEIGRDLNSSGTTNVTGGRIGDGWYAAGNVSIAGGSIGDELETRYNANVTVEGTDFRINGVPVAGLTDIGDTVKTSSYFGQLSCILADGTPLVLDIGDRDNLQARFDLKLAAPTAPGAPMIVASSDPIPLGLRQGQLLVVDAGGAVRESFTAGGGVIVIQPGGAVGDNLELLNTTALMAGGTLGDHADVFRGATLTISGGEVGDFLQVHDQGTLNVSGGTVGNFFEAKPGSTTNVSGGVLTGANVRTDAVLNVSGGQVGGVTSTGNVHLSGGGITGARIEAGWLDITGGELGSDSEAWNGTVVNLSGGRIGRRYTVGGGSVLDVRGGAIGDAIKAFGSVTLHGGEFRLNGEVIEGLSTPGERVTLDLAADALLTGVLADGTPIAFSGLDVAPNTYFDPGDSFAPGSLVLQAEPVPAIEGGDIRASRGSDPQGVRVGQRLIADAAVGNHFNAGPGSKVLVEPGGSIGENFEAVGAEVMVTGGSIGQGMDAFPGTMVLNAGGSIGDYVEIFEGATIEQTAGSIGSADVHAGGALRVSGGSVGVVESDGAASIELSGGQLDYVAVEGAASISMTGGSLNGYDADGGLLTISGGAMRDFFRVRNGSSIVLEGGDFRLDGIPIEGLAEIGTEAPVNIPDGRMLTGVLRDGTPFAMSTIDGLVEVANDVVRVRKAEIPPIGPALITASSGPVPLGIRQGQTLVVDAGASLAANFNAGWGSSVIVEAGAEVGDNLEGVGATMELRGVVGDSLGAYYGTTVRAIGATIGDGAAVKRGSSLRLEGGSIGEDLDIDDNSVVEIVGGAVGRDMQMHNSRVTMTSGSIGYDAFIYASRVDVHGGAIHGDLWVDGNSTINLSGGSGLGFGTAINSGSALNILGSGFAINGTPLSLTAGLTQTISQRNVTLSGMLADGSTFSTYLSTSHSSSSYFSTQARITVTLAAAEGDFDGSGVVDGNDLLRWQLEMGQSVAPGARSDGNRDGFVDDLDLALWRAAMERGNSASPLGLTAQAPEPSALPLGAVALVSTLSFRAGKRRRQC